MMKRFLGLAAVFAVAASLSVSAWALPSSSEVQAQVQQGRFQQAENMMQEVVTAKPDNAKAHYLYAELLAHNARFDLAAQEAKRARELDPAIKFTQPEKFNAFVQLLDREQATARANASARSNVNAPRALGGAATAPAMLPAQSSSGLPGWVWVLGLGIVGLLIWRMMSARRQQVMMSPSTGYGPSGGYGPGGMPMGNMGPMGSSGGSGMLGTGMAVAGGLAAGMLLEKVLDERHGGNTYNPGMGNSNAFEDSPAGNPSADALEQRPVDFGSGDSWDSGGSSDGGGGMDMGSGGDSW